MATLTITEYQSVGYTGSSKNQLGIYPGVGAILAEQTMSITASSTQCAALQTNTSLVELATDTACYLAFGTNPTAVAGKHLMPANTSRLYAIDSTLLIAVHS